MMLESRSSLSALSLLLAGLLVQGCVEFKMRAGSRPDVTLLEQKLVMNGSTQEEVAGLLGQPFGTGAAMLPFHDAPRDMWSYYYEEGTRKDDRRMFLFVYFDKTGRYEGYMWFSSLPQ